MNHPAFGGEFDHHHSRGLEALKAETVSAVWQTIKKEAKADPIWEVYCRIVYIWAGIEAEIQAEDAALPISAKSLSAELARASQAISRIEAALDGMSEEARDSLCRAAYESHIDAGSEGQDASDAAKILHQLGAVQSRVRSDLQFLSRLIDTAMGELKRDIHSKKSPREKALIADRVDGLKSLALIYLHLTGKPPDSRAEGADNSGVFWQHFAYPLLRDIYGTKGHGSAAGLAKEVSRVVAEMLKEPRRHSLPYLPTLPELRFVSD